VRIRSQGIVLSFALASSAWAISPKEVNALLDAKMAKYKDFNQAMTEAMVETYSSAIKKDPALANDPNFLKKLQADFKQADQTKQLACEETAKIPTPPGGSESGAMEGATGAAVGATGSPTANTVAGGSAAGDSAAATEAPEGAKQEFCSPEGEGLADNAIKGGSEGIANLPKPDAGGTANGPIAGDKPSSPSPVTTNKGDVQGPGPDFDGGETLNSTNASTIQVQDRTPASTRIDTVLESDSAVAKRSNPEDASQAVFQAPGHGGEVPVAAMPNGPADTARSASEKPAAALVSELKETLDSRVTRREITPEQAEKVLEKVTPFIEEGASLETALVKAQTELTRGNAASLRNEDGAAPASASPTGSPVLLAGGAPTSGLSTTEAAEKLAQMPLTVSKEKIETPKELPISGSSPSALTAANSLFSEKAKVDATTPAGPLTSNNPSWFAKVRSNIGGLVDSVVSALKFDSVSGDALRGVASQDDGDSAPLELPALEDETTLALASFGGSSSRAADSGAALGLVFFGLAFATALGGMAGWRRFKRRS